MEPRRTFANKEAQAAFAAAINNKYSPIDRKPTEINTIKGSLEKHLFPKDSSLAPQTGQHIVLKQMFDDEPYEILYAVEKIDISSTGDYIYGLVPVIRPELQDLASGTISLAAGYEACVHLLVMGQWNEQTAKTIVAWIEKGNHTRIKITASKKWQLELELLLSPEICAINYLPFNVTNELVDDLDDGEEPFNMKDTFFPLLDGLDDREEPFSIRDTFFSLLHALKQNLISLGNNIKNRLSSLLFSSEAIPPTSPITIERRDLVFPPSTTTNNPVVAAPLLSSPYSTSHSPTLPKSSFSSPQPPSPEKRVPVSSFEEKEKEKENRHDLSSTASLQSSLSKKSVSFPVPISQIEKPLLFNLTTSSLTSSLSRTPNKPALKKLSVPPLVYMQSPTVYNESPDSTPNLSSSSASSLYSPTASTLSPISSNGSLPYCYFPFNYSPSSPTSLTPPSSTVINHASVPLQPPWGY